MKISLRLAVAFLLSTFAFYAAPAHATRTDSGYSPSGLTMDFPGGLYWAGTFVLCTTGVPACTAEFGPELLLEVTPNNLSLPLDVTLDLSASFSADSPLGQINCTGGSPALLGTFGSMSPPIGPCTYSTTNGIPPAGCVLPNPTPGADITIVIPSNCLQAGEVFYFDLADFADFTNISITPGTPTVPEPSSLALLGAALIPVAFLAMRRKEA